MQDDERDRSRTSWARLRFAVVGPLLAAPPARGELQAEIARLAEKSWRHPRTGEPVRFGRSTIERWLYAARTSRDPVGALARAVRRDRGSRPSLPLALRTVLRQQYEEHPTWTVRLHYDNLPARLAESPELRELPLPSYHSVPASCAPRVSFASGHPPWRRPAGGGPPRHRRLRGAQLRGGAHPRALARRLPPRLAQGAHGGRRLGHASAGVLPRRPLAPGLPSPVVPRGDGRVLRPRAHPGDLEARSPARAPDRQRAGDARRRDPRRARQASASCTTARSPMPPTRTPSRRSSGHRWRDGSWPCSKASHDLTLERLNEATQAWVELEYHRRLHSRARLHTARALPRRAEPRAPEPLARGAAARLSRRGRAHPAPQRRHPLAARPPLRGAGALPPPPAPPPAVRHLGPLSRRSRRPGHRGDPGTALPARQAQQRRRAAAPHHSERGGARVESRADAPASGMAPLLAELLAQYAATGLPPAYLPKELNTNKGEGEDQ